MLCWVLFFPPPLIPWPPMGRCMGLKRAHENASSLQTNPDIKGGCEGEPKSLNQRHRFIFAAPSALPGGSQANVAPQDKVDIQPPAHPRGTLGLTPPQQHPFSIHHLTCCWKRRSSSSPCLSSFCSAAQTHTSKQPSGMALQSQGYFNDQSEGQPLTSPWGMR